MITQQIRNSLMFIAISSYFVSCGGGIMSSKDDKSEKKQDKPAPAADQKASDPEAVTGAYLACQSSPSDAPSTTSDAIGCSIKISNDPRVPSINQIHKFVSMFQAKESESDAAYASAATQKKLPFQALFIHPKSQTSQTKYLGRILKANGELITELSCEGSKLPCTSAPSSTPAPLNLNEFPFPSIGSWTTANMTTSSMAAAKALDPACPNNPDLYCDANGNISSNPPSSKLDLFPDTRNHCLSKTQSKIGGFIKAITGGLIDPLTLFGKKPTPKSGIQILKRADGCVVPKVIQTSAPSKLVNVGSGCGIVMVRTPGGDVVNHIVPKSVNEADMEARLKPFMCKP